MNEGRALERERTAPGFESPGPQKWDKRESPWLLVTLTIRFYLGCLEPWLESPCSWALKPSLEPVSRPHHRLKPRIQPSTMEGPSIQQRKVNLGELESKILQTTLTPWREAICQGDRSASFPLDWSHPGGYHYPLTLSFQWSVSTIYTFTIRTT